MSRLDGISEQGTKHVTQGEVAMGAPDLPHDRGQSIRITPRPVKFKICQLNGVTAIMRFWDNGDDQRCRLCSVCSAERGVCTVLTEESVTDEQAPLYSSLDLDFGDGLPSLIRAPLGLVVG
jgi:hypothetical protein